MSSGEKQVIPKVYIILNPVAGHSSVDLIRRAIEDHFNDSGMTFEVYETTGREDVAEITQTACQRGVELVIAAGGDGTVAGVVNGLKDSHVPLGIVPVGTGNGLARALGIPLEPEKAVALIAGEHKMMKLDAMQVDDRFFVLNVSAGISARAMRETQPEVKQRFGIAAYAWNIFGEIVGFRPRQFILTVDGHRVQVRATEVLVSNGALLKEPPFPLGPPEFFNDAQFDVYIVTARSLFEYLRVVWGLILRPFGRKTDLRHLTAKERVVIEALRRPQPVQADGEVIGRTPVDVRLVHDALNVIVPMDTASSGHMETVTENRR